MVPVRRRAVSGLAGASVKRSAFQRRSASLGGGGGIRTLVGPRGPEGCSRPPQHVSSLTCTVGPCYARAGASSLGPLGGHMSHRYEPKRRAYQHSLELAVCSTFSGRPKSAEAPGDDLKSAVPAWGVRV